ncbi:MAG TPA: hypothetical protein VIK55_14155 [Paludibacter sp.]
MKKEKVNEITNLLEDTFNERNVNVQLLLDSLLTEDDYDPEFEGLTPFRICYLAVEETCYLLEQSDSLDKLKELIVKRRYLLNLDRNDFYNNIGEKIAEKLSLKPLIIEVSDEIEKLETLQRTGLLTTEKQEETKTDKDIDLISNEIEVLIPNYISIIDKNNLKDLLKINSSAKKINWEKSIKSLLSTVNDWHNRKIILFPTGTTAKEYIIKNFTVKNKEINIRSLNNEIALSWKT